MNPRALTHPTQITTLVVILCQIFTITHMLPVTSPIKKSDLDILIDPIAQSELSGLASKKVVAKSVYNTVIRVTSTPCEAGMQRVREGGPCVTRYSGSGPVLDEEYQLSILKGITSQGGIRRRPSSQGHRNRHRDRTTTNTVPSTPATDPTQSTMTLPNLGSDDIVQVEITSTITNPMISNLSALENQRTVPTPSDSRPSTSSAPPSKTEDTTANENGSVNKVEDFVQTTIHPDVSNSSPVKSTEMPSETDSNQNEDIKVSNEDIGFTTTMLPITSVKIDEIVFDINPGSTDISMNIEADEVISTIKPVSDQTSAYVLDDNDNLPTSGPTKTEKSVEPLMLGQNVMVNLNPEKVTSFDINPSTPTIPTIDTNTDSFSSVSPLIKINNMKSNPTPIIGTDTTPTKPSTTSYSKPVTDPGVTDTDQTEENHTTPEITLKLSPSTSFTTMVDQILTDDEDPSIITTSTPRQLTEVQSSESITPTSTSHAPVTDSLGTRLAETNLQMQSFNYTDNSMTEMNTRLPDETNRIFQNEEKVEDTDTAEKNETDKLLQVANNMSPGQVRQNPDSHSDLTLPLSTSNPPRHIHDFEIDPTSQDLTTALNGDGEGVSTSRTENSEEGIVPKIKPGSTEQLIFPDDPSSESVPSRFMRRQENSPVSDHSLFHSGHQSHELESTGHSRRIQFPGSLSQWLFQTSPTPSLRSDNPLTLGVAHQSQEEEIDRIHHRSKTRNRSKNPEVSEPFGFGLESVSRSTPPQFGESHERFNWQTSSKSPLAMNHGADFMLNSETHYPRFASLDFERLGDKYRRFRVF